jgi:thiol:disulfide interchange protein
MEGQDERGGAVWSNSSQRNSRSISGILFLLTYAAAYLAGVLVSFTPCVYPVVPITAAVIGAQGGVSRGQGLILSLSFVLASRLRTRPSGGSRP